MLFHYLSPHLLFCQLLSSSKKLDACTCSTAKTNLLFWPQSGYHAWLHAVVMARAKIFGGPKFPWQLFAYNWDRENCPLYGVAGCLLLRACLSIEVNGKTVGTFRIVRYIVGVRCWGVSVKRGSTVYACACLPLTAMHMHALLTGAYRAEFLSQIRLQGKTLAYWVVLSQGHTFLLTSPLVKDRKGGCFDKACQIWFRLISPTLISPTLISPTLISPILILLTEDQFMSFRLLSFRLLSFCLLMTSLCHFAYTTCNDVRITSG